MASEALNQDDYLHSCEGCQGPTPIWRRMCKECRWDQRTYQREMWSQPRETPNAD